MTPNATCRILDKDLNKNVTEYDDKVAPATRKPGELLLTVQENELPHEWNLQALLRMNFLNWTKWTSSMWWFHCVRTLTIFRQIKHLNFQNEQTRLWSHNQIFLVFMWIYHNFLHSSSTIEENLNYLRFLNCSPWWTLYWHIMQWIHLDVLQWRQE